MVKCYNFLRLKVVFLTVDIF